MDKESYTADICVTSTSCSYQVADHEGLVIWSGYLQCPNPVDARKKTLELIIGMRLEYPKLLVNDCSKYPLGDGTES